MAVDITDKIALDRCKILTIMKVTANLSKDNVLECLRSPVLFIGGEFFRTPRNQLIRMLHRDSYGQVELELERIDSEAELYLLNRKA